MKTTVEISDSLFRDARKYAQAHDITFREVVETGLRNLVLASSAAKKPFRLQKCSFRGDGMAKDLLWPEIRSIIYEGRGE